MQSGIVEQNIKYSFINFIVVNMLRFILQIVLLRTVSIEYLGLNGLFTNLLSVLSLAELGVSSSFTYSLYKPLAVNDRETIKSIMQLFRKVYICIGCTIFALGLCAYPWLEFFIKGNHHIQDINYFYLAFLFDTAVSYFWSYQRVLLQADQKLYIVNIYQIVVQVFGSLLKIGMLYITRNYWVVAIVKILETIVENFVIYRKSFAEYSFLREGAQPINYAVKSEIIRNIKAMMIHRTSGTIVFGTSNIIISKFVGLAAVGVYSNYALVTKLLESVANKFFEALSASIGNMLVLDSKDEQIKRFRICQFLTAFIASVICAGLYATIDSFMILWAGKNYLLDKTTVLSMIVLFYITFMRKTPIAFSLAGGLFWYDRYKAVAEMIINIIACVYLTKEYGVIGVVVGTIISTMLTCFWVEPYIISRYGVGISLRQHFLDYLLFTMVTIVTVFSSNFLYKSCFTEGTLIGFLTGIILCITVTCIVWWICFRKRMEYLCLKDIVMGRLKIGAKK